MGMLKEGVRLDRVRGGRQKYRRTSEAPYQGQSFSIKKLNLDGKNQDFPSVHPFYSVFFHYLQIIESYRH